MKILMIIPVVIVLLVLAVYWFELDTLALRKLEPWFRKHSHKPGQE